MKKLFLFVGLFLMLASLTNAQNVAKRTVNLTPQAVKSFSAVTSSVNENVTNTPNRCGTVEYMEQQKALDPTLESRLQQLEEWTQEWIKNNPDYDQKTVITVPVVVHVVWNTSAQNISDARVQEQIDVLNTDYAGLNTHSMEAFNTSLKSNTELQFCLAQRDPSDNATNGIERRQTTVVTFSPNDAMKFYSQGGLNQWNPNKYMNIWVCNIPSLCGYAITPTSPLSNVYGVVIHYQFFGVTGAVPPYNLGGTTSHEIGHCFNVYHIWGDDGGTCSGSDGCADTPNQGDYNINTGNWSGVHTDACSPSSPGMMWMNFMDYSDDIDYANFTPNQKSRIQACFVTGAPLNALAGSNGCTPVVPAAPVAAFTWTPASPVVNTSAQFTDQSTNIPTSWLWNFGDGQTSTLQNPTHTYTATGPYNVCLTATNGLGSNQVCHTVTVVATPPAGCDTVLPASFASGTCAWAIYYADAAPHDSGFVSGSNAYLDKEKAMLYTGVANGTVSDVYVMYGLKVGTTGNTSVKIYSSNAGAPGTLLGTSATIVKSAVDTTNQGINFDNKYHFASPISVGSDFFVSVVLPATWANGTNELAIWGETYTCSSTSSLAYEMWSDNAWHSFTTVYGTNIDMAIFPDICTTVGIDETISQNSVSIYPNPASNAFTIVFSGNQQKDVTVNVYNMIGKLVKSISLNSITYKMFIDMSSETTGIYIVNIKTSQGTIIKKLSLIK